jgi:hypothetical protein
MLQETRNGLSCAAPPTGFELIVRVDPNLVTKVEQPELHVSDSGSGAMILKPLAIWALVALFFAGCATLVALFAPAAKSVPTVELPAPGEPVEAAALIVPLQRLAEENRKLVDRLTAVERQLAEATGSVVGAPGATRLADNQPVPSLPPAFAQNEREPVSTLRFAAPNSRAPTQTPGAGLRVDQGNAGQKTDFAVDLGSDTALDGMRLRWAALISKHRTVLDGLEPRVGIREGTGGAAELRLLVGPLTNAEAAARICAALASSGTACQSALYGGQRLGR